MTDRRVYVSAAWSELAPNRERTSTALLDAAPADQLAALRDAAPPLVGIVDAHLRPSRGRVAAVVTAPTRHQAVQALDHFLRERLAADGWRARDLRVTEAELS